MNRRELWLPRGDLLSGCARPLALACRASAQRSGAQSALRSADVRAANCDEELYGCCAEAMIQRYERRDRGIRNPIVVPESERRVGEISRRY